MTAIATEGQGRATVAARARRPLRESGLYLAILGCLWASNVYGFGRSSILRLTGDGPAYPPIVHVHAAAFVGWMVLFTAQMLLVRRGSLRLHRRLGMWLAALAVAMLLVSPFAAVQSNAQKLAQPGFPGGLIFVQLADLLLFAGLVGAALTLRHRPGPHKRLMMLAMINLSTAGFGRWATGPIAAAAGPSFAGTWLAGNLPVVLLMAAMVAFDLATRRRLDRSFVAALAAIFAVQLFQTWAVWSPTADAAGRAFIRMAAG